MVGPREPAPAVPMPPEGGAVAADERGHAVDETSFAPCSRVLLSSAVVATVFVYDECTPAAWAHGPPQHGLEVHDVARPCCRSSRIKRTGVFSS